MASSSEGEELDERTVDALRQNTNRYVELCELIDGNKRRIAELREEMKPWEQERATLEQPIKTTMVQGDIGKVEVNENVLKVSKRKSARAPTKPVLQERVRQVCRERFQCQDDTAINDAVEYIWSKMDPEEKVVLQRKALH
jgi:acetyl-CoA carboxylase alpha subunit